MPFVGPVTGEPGVMTRSTGFTLSGSVSFARTPAAGTVSTPSCGIVP